MRDKKQENRIKPKSTVPMKEEREENADMKTEDTVMIEKIVNSIIHGK